MLKLLELGYNVMKHAYAVTCYAFCFLLAEMRETMNVTT